MFISSFANPCSSSASSRIPFFFLSMRYVDIWLDAGRIIEYVMSESTMGRGEIIWVVVSGTAVVSERGPGRVFGDQKGGGGWITIFVFSGPSWGARSALRV